MINMSKKTKHMTKLKNTKKKKKRTDRTLKKTQIFSFMCV